MRNATMMESKPTQATQAERATSREREVHSWVRVLAAVIAAIAVTTAVTWPVALHLDDHIVDGAKAHTDQRTNRRSQWGRMQLAADVYQSTWVFAWERRGLLTQPLHLFDANILYPAPLALARADHAFGTGLLSFPGGLVAGPVVGHQTALLLCGIFNFLAAAYLARHWFGSKVAAFVAGSLCVISAYRVGQIYHIQSLLVAYIPIMLVALDRFAATGGRRWLALGGVAISLQVISGQYLAYWGAATWGIAGAVALIAGRPSERPLHRFGRDLGWYACTSAVSLALVLPLSWPYLLLAQSGEFPEHVGRRVLNAVVDLRAYVLHESGQPHLFIGLPIWLAATIGGVTLLTGDRRSRIRLLMLLGCGLAGLMISMGPPPYGLELYNVIAPFIPGFETMREPSRAAILVHLAVMLLAGCGAATVATRGRRPGLLLVIALLGWTYHQYPLRPVPLRPVATASDLPAVYEYLARCGAGDPLLELPIYKTWTSGKSAERMYMSTYHWLPLINGRVSYEPPERTEIVRLAARLPETVAVARLRNITGVRWILVDCDLAADVPQFSNRLCRWGGWPLAVATHRFGSKLLFDLGPVYELPRAYPRRWAADASCLVETSAGGMHPRGS